MIKQSDAKELQELLALSDEPEETFTLAELEGFLYGLVITPDMIMPSHWLPVIFGGGFPEFTAEAQAERLMESLMKVYNEFVEKFHKNTLEFPYDYTMLSKESMIRCIDWVSGFAAALSLQPDAWDPDTYPELSEEEGDELYFSYMVIMGVAYDDVRVDFWENEVDRKLMEEMIRVAEIPDEEFSRQVELYLFFTLPDAVGVLQRHGKKADRWRQQEMQTELSATTVRRGEKIGRNDPCPCNSGKKYKKCCGGAATSDRGSNSNVIAVDFQKKKRLEKKAVEKDASGRIYQLKIGLKGAKPPIWRRVLVPGDYTLADLHIIIQICMGWYDSHLHEFQIGGMAYGVPDYEDVFEGTGLLDEEQYTLDAVRDRMGSWFTYVYDFGDFWAHRIDVEKISAREPETTCPRLLTGRRACPPEDSGGIYGYLDLLEVLSDPEDERYEEISEWVGSDFDPAVFDKREKEEINELLVEFFED